jgi:hypothetical protein
VVLPSMVTEHRRDRLGAATTCFVVILRWLNLVKLLLARPVSSATMYR